MSDWTQLALLLLAAWVVPVAVVEGFAREMTRRGAGVENYRGRKVFLGLGVAWLAMSVAAMAFRSGAAQTIGGKGLAILLPGVFAFGLLDDAFGSGADRGFRGHLRALAEGRLTTGMLKLLGIGALALVASPDRIWPSGGYSPARGALAWVLGAAVIALTANLVNLVDLRPARALKVYVLLAVPAAMAAGALYATASSRSMAAGFGALLVLGPAAAAWPYDAGERGMLGDAGANAAGAFAGYLAAASLPLPWLGAWAVVLLALNLASERVSFSALIDRNGLLRKLDGIGRLK